MNVTGPEGANMICQT